MKNRKLYLREVHTKGQKNHKIFNFKLQKNMGQITPMIGGVCIPTTRDAVEYFGKNIPAGRENDGTGVLQFLLSPANTSGFQKISNDIKGVAGKKRGVRVWTDKPLCFQVAATPFNCLETATPLSPALEVFEYDIESRFTPIDTNGDIAEYVVTASDLANYCEIDDAEYFKKKVLETDMRFLKELNKVAVDLMKTLIPAPAVKRKIIIENQLTGQRVVNDELPLWIDELATSAGLMSNDYVLLGGQMVNFLKSKYKQGTISTEGAEIVDTTLPPMYYDRYIDTVFGKNALVMVPKGVFQLVNFVQYVGSRQFLGEKQILTSKELSVGNASSIIIDGKYDHDTECFSYKYLPSTFLELVKSIPGSCKDANADGIFIIEECSPILTQVCQ